MTDHEPLGAGDDAQHVRPLRQPRLSAAQTEQYKIFYVKQMPRLVTLVMIGGAPLELAVVVAQETLTRAYRLWTTIENPHRWVRDVALKELNRRLSDNQGISADELSEGRLLLRSIPTMVEWRARHNILSTLTEIPPRQRQVLALTLDGNAPDEIAELLNISPETVQTDLSEARLALLNKKLSLGEDES